MAAPMMGAEGFFVIDCSIRLRRNNSYSRGVTPA
jgi:hypothetical protein